MEQRIASLEIAVSRLNLVFLKAMPMEESRAEAGDVRTDEGAVADLYSVPSERCMITQWKDVQAELVRFRKLFEVLQSVVPKYVSDAMSTASKTVDVRSSFGEDSSSSVEKLISNVDLERLRSELKEDLRCDLDRLRQAIGGRQCELDVITTRRVLDLDPYTPAFVSLSEISFKIDTEAAELEAVARTLPPGLDTEYDSRGKHDKRREIIQNIKGKPIYTEYIAILARGEALTCEVPLTPDPEDATISKRKWESLVSMWRDALRQVSKSTLLDEPTDLPVRSGDDRVFLLDALE